MQEQQAYKCDKCDFCTIRKSCLTKHISTRHNIMDGLQAQAQQTIQKAKPTETTTYAP